VEERLEFFRKVRDTIEERIRGFLGVAFSERCKF